MTPFGYWAPQWGVGCPTGYGYTYLRVVLGWAGIWNGWPQTDVSPTVTWRNSRHHTMRDRYGRPIPSPVFMTTSNGVTTQ